MKKNPLFPMIIIEPQKECRFEQKKESGEDHFRKKENFYGLVQHMLKLVRACSEHVHFQKKGVNKFFGRKESITFHST